MIEDIVKALRKVVKDQEDLDLIREVHEEQPPKIDPSLILDQKNIKNDFNNFYNIINTKKDLCKFDNFLKRSSSRNFLKVIPKDE